MGDRTVKILQAIALFNEPQRRREHRERRERSHNRDFTGDAFGGLRLRFFERTWYVRSLFNLLILY
ncbi:hypothetical protein [Nostoc sp.]|uniref:hypothetical protein n=1 Tax=Nostoc sp. TaxID=1180 RepID=UPI002FF6622D